MKRIIMVLLAICLLLSLAACTETPAATTDTPGAGTSGTPTRPTSGTPPTTATPTTPTTIPTTPTTPTTPSTAPTQPSHTHTADAWWADKDNHWNICQCGEIFNIEAHYVEEDVCIHCGSGVRTDVAGYTYVEMYDDYFNCVLFIVYDVDGTLLYEDTYEYTYDADGNVLALKEYSNGVLAYEAGYAVSDDGISCIVKDTMYWEDGSKVYMEYDEYENAVVEIRYTADGAVEYSMRYEYTYDDEGNMLSQLIYEDDVLTTECEYGLFEEDGFVWDYLKKKTTYNEDGTVTVTEYNEEGEIISEGYYDADGNIIDSSAKFDPTVCAPLFGTWQGDMIMDGEMQGIEGMEIRAVMTITFIENGEMVLRTSIDMESFKATMLNVIYAPFIESGMTKEDADDAFLAQMGMTIEQYVDFIFLSPEMMEQMNQELNMVYYVEDNKIYAGSSWTASMEPAEFTLDGNVLILHETFEDAEDMGQTIELTKVEA